MAGSLSLRILGKAIRHGSSYVSWHQIMFFVLCACVWLCRCVGVCVWQEAIEGGQSYACCVFRVTVVHSGVSHSPRMRGKERGSARQTERERMKE